MAGKTAILALAAAVVAIASPVSEEARIHARQSGQFNAAPVYPSPKGGWVPEWSAAYAKAKAVVGQMTLAEKVNITTAVGFENGQCVGNTGPVYRFGIPSFCAQDGPLGVRYADLITVFPAGITAGATWNKELIYDRAKAMGEEAKGKGVHVLLGPSIGPLGRQPLGGRNWEGFGSDPYIQGVGGYETVKGIQDAGVQACAKHFIANEQEHYRGDGAISNTISANVDDRTMHEVYGWPFSEAVRAGVTSIMCSYNKINGSYGCENSQLLNGFLKNELGFQGYVMADWLAQRSGVASSLAGLDQTQPGDGGRWQDGNSYWGPELSRSILNGSIPVDRLNDQVTRIVASWYQLGQDKNYPTINFSSFTKSDSGPAHSKTKSGPQIRLNYHVDVRGNHAAVARQVAREGITLLKNEGNILPLSTNAVVRVFGSGAAVNPQGPNACVDRACNTGTLGMGWGSGTADYASFSSPIDAIKAKASNVNQVLSDQVSSQTTQMASESNARCLVFVSADSGEAYITVNGNVGDRNDYNLWNNGENLITAVANACANTIVIVHTVGPVSMEKFADLPNVKAIVVAHLPGQEAGSSLADILFGDYSPSGKLPYTIAKNVNDFGSSVAIVKSGNAQQQFTEGLYIDYKYFDKNNITPRYAFGHGLSYTTFTLSNAKVTTTKTPTEQPPAPPSRVAVPTYSTAIPNANEVAWPSLPQRINGYIYPYLDNPGSIQRGNYPYPAGYKTTENAPSPAGGAQGGNPALFEEIYSVSVDVKNTGSRTAKAVVQLYLQFPSGTSYDTPVRQLRGFEKVEVAAGATKTVTLSLTRKDLSVWDVVKQQWIIPGAGAGGYTIHLGHSSRDLPVKCSTSTGTCSSA